MAFGSEIQSLLVDQIKSRSESSHPLVGEFVSQMKSESDALALKTVASAAESLAKAVAEGMPQSVVDAYERILTRASSR